MYTALDITSILQLKKSVLPQPEAVIKYIVMDTRRIDHPTESMFFAMNGSMHDGRSFIQDAIKQGVRSIVCTDISAQHSESVNYFFVEDTLKAMQKLVGYHRQQFDIPVIGITGSNGKTTIKEWLYQLINDRKVVKSPKSFNSQTGVPLSVWQLSADDQLAIFEAGISQPNEMFALQEIIRPTIGLFSMIGDAHSEGFRHQKEKLDEKLVLFRDAEYIIFNEDDQEVSSSINNIYAEKHLLSWGKSENSNLYRILNLYITKDRKTIVDLKFEGHSDSILIPFSDSASINNALHCIAVLLFLRFDFDRIKEGIAKLHNIPMRLEMKNGVQGSILINDTYNADLQSFKIALEFLSQQAGSRDKVVILSDFMQTGLHKEDLNILLAAQLKHHDVNHVIGIGHLLKELENYLDPFMVFSWYENAEELIRHLDEHEFENKAILVKGARFFYLEKVIEALSEKVHTSTLETDLQAIEHNLKVFSNQLGQKTKIIAVIKASAYGSGSEELARFLEFKKVSYLAVAFIDEGIQLRKAGVLLPIIILNPDRNGVSDMVNFKLEPEVYSIDQLLEIIKYLDSQPSENRFNIHIKIDTGMHRLGFVAEDIDQLNQILVTNTDRLHIRSIFSHLSSSEDPTDDQFTHEQAAQLVNVYEKIVKYLGYRPLKHILNSSGIIRFPQYHFDLVRLGLGLYGIDSTSNIETHLEKAHTLKATVIQIKNVSASEYIGYNRKGKLKKDGKIAIINIGYADGLMRQAGNGNYSVKIGQHDFPIIGNVCMDLTILDIGNNKTIAVGDEVIIFGKNKSIETLAKVCHTIPYEILSRISGRVRRLYIQG